MLQGLVPSLLVEELEPMLQFYERLGFVVSGLDSERANARWAEVRRDAVILQFYLDTPVNTPTSPALSGTLYVATSNVDALADEISFEVQLEWGPETMDYGVREFGVRDPAGYLIAFTQPVSSDGA